ncbi:SusC/RagA family TonB-linked outer membrane protein [Chitinophaga polysaccharea]|uniref:SusC/RagA family TonB-linked outer membrane protein n=1 Tax=Chitinophaga polysaccharea TaxID=1293035 RepID=UPI001455785F|nr:SusC/RagA family TonB-linked outer membrane protein [Chitinophaga polysaccharea]NLR57578.1 SusC/RagA family TonB-linked outer membrane protein [Chitinophaga polysaccharea]
MKKMLGLPSFRRVMQGHAVPLLLLSFLLLVTGIVRAQSSYSVLDSRITYHASGLPLPTVLKEIRAITKLRFTYNNDLVRKGPAVTVDQKNGTLRELLKRVLANSGLEFVEDLGGVVIYAEKPTPASEKISEKEVAFRVLGQVYTNDGEPLAGATVQILGSRDGTTTATDGVFSLWMTDHQQFRVSMLGMKTVVRTVTRAEAEKVFMKIKLDTAAQAISEVVVNGYQKIDARMSTAAVYTLTAAEALQPGETSIDKMLQGKVPGLMILNSSGSVNARPTVRMRGTSTFVGNASPLWVIDDVVRPDPVDISATQLNNVISDAQTGDFSLIGGAISGLNPYDIEKITFLKDAAATAIYGVRAANGVIVVTTKRGKAGPMQVSYNTSLSFQQRPSYSNLNLMNSQQRVQLSRELYAGGLLQNTSNGLAENISYEGLLQALNSRQITEPQFKTAVGKLQTNNTDWFKLLFRNAFNMTHSVSMGGGAGKTTYYGSLSYTDGKGAAQLDGLKRYTADLAIHSEATKRLTLDFKLMGNYSESKGYYAGVNPLNYALQTSRILDPSVIYPVNISGNGVLPKPPPITFNMQNELAQTENNNSIRSMTVGLVISYKIANGLVFRNTSSAITDAAESMQAAYEGSKAISDKRGWNLGFEPNDKQLAQSPIPYGGIATIANQNVLTLNTRNMLEYNTGLFKGRDQFIASAGVEINSSQIKGVSSTQPGYFPDRGMAFFPSPASMFAIGRTTLTRVLTNTLSMFGTATYSLNSRYIFSATVRTDGSNRFGQYSNAKFLPNFGLAGKWNVASESWLQTSRIFSGLDLRATFGTQGNVVSAVGPELIASYLPVTKDNYNPITGVPFLNIKSLPYPELRWEKTYQWNFGVDLSLFDRRVNVNADYYIKHSKDLIVSRILPFEYGIADMYKNAGTLTNQGLEIHLGVEAIRSKNVNLTLNFINSKNFNQIGTNDFHNNYADYLTGRAFVPGRPISGFYSYIYTGLNGTNGLPTFHIPGDKANLDDPTTFLVYSGQLQPVFNGSFSTSFRYKSFATTAEFYYALGGHKRLNPLSTQVQSDNGVPTPFTNVSKELIDRWRKPGDEKVTNVPAIVDVTTNTFYGNFPDDVYAAYNQSDLRVVNSSFMRCRSFRLDYFWPQQMVRRIGVKSITTGLFINNLFTVASSKLHGQDPEIDGVGTTALPITRQYGFNMNVNF